MNGAYPVTTEFMDGRDISTIARHQKWTPAKVQKELRAELKRLADEAAALSEEVTETTERAMELKVSTRGDQWAHVRRLLWDVINGETRLAEWTVEQLAMRTALHEAAVLQALKAMSLDGLVERTRTAPHTWRLKPRVAREV